MFYLLASVVLTAYLILVFKLAERFGISVFQTIVFNYIFCAITGSLVNGSFAVNSDNIQTSWFPWSCAMGLIFLILYNLVVITTKTISASVATVSYKVSLVIPAVFSVFLYNEKLVILQWLGLVLAVLSVVLACWPGKGAGVHQTKKRYLFYLLPAILFLGSGLQDTLIKYIEQAYLNDSNKDAFLSCAFAMASVAGLVALAVRIVRRQQIFHWKNVLAGLLVGVPNYFSIWCLVKFLQLSPGKSSAAIPINNMGIVLFGTVGAWMLFKEQLSEINWVGVVLALAAIFLIAFGNKL